MDHLRGATDLKILLRATLEITTFTKPWRHALRKLDDLIVFIRVVDCASFSAAARSLNLTPTTVSKQIAPL
ncbi:LysR family transcriptional regulator [Acidithiobacillus thiooxidans]|uniref:helix-turn-helix domain-containing protein n=1 Tax=Acidithiobacillus thiooxidans TaxID=930 RepID=UPI00285FEE23|nr:LysR family transcriptional regulator [Acidithiobacillus thiooxidans]MDR7928698.1 LysR family transcriptional regulator [Acidithiobacillus thiooxidans]